MKIIDVRIDVIKRDLPDIGLDSDLGRFFGEVEQGVLRIFTDEGIEGNCFVGEFRNGSNSLNKSPTQYPAELAIGIAPLPVA